MTGDRSVVFGGGCFWCTEAVFKMLRGVKKVEPGYAGGKTVNPKYEEVKTGHTGHAEVVRITYDPRDISYKDLLTVFFGSHDPTMLNRQGNDIGEQYRSAVFYTEKWEKEEAVEMIKELNKTIHDGTRIVTKVEELTEFFPAETYHRDYYEKNPSERYCQLIIEPKLEKVRHRFAVLLKLKQTDGPMDG